MLARGWGGVVELPCIGGMDHYTYLLDYSNVWNLRDEMLFFGDSLKENVSKGAIGKGIFP